MWTQWTCGSSPHCMKQLANQEQRWQQRYLVVNFYPSQKDLPIILPIFVALDSYAVVLKSSPGDFCPILFWAKKWVSLLLLNWWLLSASNQYCRTELCQLYNHTPMRFRFCLWHHEHIWISEIWIWFQNLWRNRLDLVLIGFTRICCADLFLHPDSSFVTLSILDVWLDILIRQ